MNANEIRFEEFLSQPKTNILIPVYQRNYDWQNVQCNEFIKDIEILAKKEKDNHFLGSVVYIKGDDDFKGRERRIITNQSELCRKPIKLNDNVDIYIESNLSATAILKYMKLIAEKYELEDDDVVFYVG
jgi:hypothetical protein